jgi:hypothetical protein
MNEEMKKAWLIVAETIDDPTDKDFNVFMLTWALAIKAEREECAKVCDAEFNEWIDKYDDGAVSVKSCAEAIRKRGAV